MSRLFGNPIQIGNVVPDIHRAMQGCLQAEIGPFFIHENFECRARYRGQRQDLVFSCAFAYSGNIQVEFIQQENDVPSAFRDYLELHPEGGLHHMAYYCDDIQQTIAAANKDKQRYDLVEEFIFPDDAVHEAYLVPTNNIPGSLAIQLVNRNNPSSVEFFEAMERIAADWDGTDPIRPMHDIVKQ